jgi:hypothetical protein
MGLLTKPNLRSGAFTRTYNKTHKETQKIKKGCAEVLLALPRYASVRGASSR